MGGVQRLGGQRAVGGGVAASGSGDRDSLRHRRQDYLLQASRAEEVLENPDQYGKDLEEVRWQICGAVAEDLENDYGEGIEDLIRKAYDNAGVPGLE